MLASVIGTDDIRRTYDVIRPCIRRTPVIQADLGFTPASLSWVMDSYLIAFGGLLLLSGRLGDLFGRKRMFLAGLAVFTLASLACGLAVLLAAIGLYGVISYTVAQRTNEIGVRMALGAQRSGVIGLILAEVGVLIAIGVVVGVGLTLAGTKAASSLLYGLKPRDPLTLVLAIVVLVAIGFGASFIPARRATRIDPIVALRYE